MWWRLSMGLHLCAHFRIRTITQPTRAAAKGGRSQQPASQAKQKPPRPRAEGKGSQGQDTKAEREAGAAEGSGSGSGGGGGAGGDGEGEGLGPAAPLWDLASGVDFGEEVDKPPEVSESDFWMNGGVLFDPGVGYEYSFSLIHHRFCGVVLSNRSWTSGSGWP